MANSEVEKLMKMLDITEAEAVEMIEFDKEVDKMSMKEVDNDLTAEQKKTVKQMKNVGSKTKAPTEYTFTKRERKPDDVKIKTITDLANYLIEQGYADVVISNPSKVVDFTIDGVQFSLSLTRHRPKKG